MTFGLQWTKPPTFDYAVYFSNHLLMVAVRFLPSQGRETMLIGL